MYSKKLSAEPVEIMMMMQSPRFLYHYFFLSYLLVVGLCFPYTRELPLNDWPTAFFTMTAYLSYAFMYLLPALFMTIITYWILSFKYSGSFSRARIIIVGTVAVISATLTDLFLLTDQTIFRLFGFHLNGFVWNLVTTPGGIESMGNSQSTELFFTLMIAGLFCLQIIFFGMAQWFVQYNRPAKIKPQYPFKFQYRYVLLLWVACTVTERLTYGISDINAYTPVLNAAQTVPVYMPTTFAKLGARLGFEAKRNAHFKALDSAGLKNSGLQYPLKPLEIQAPQKPYNIIWLVAESWRWDTLTPEIMPYTTAFAKTARRYETHYSGGNGTRIGMFTQFYGLYGPTWFKFLNERRSPVLMDVLQSQNYQFQLFTSAKFSYPEFDKTIFVNIPSEFMHEYHEKTGWERDRKNVSDLIESLKIRDPNRPFMRFMFFESPHAHYYFPEESVIRRPYLDDFNYATLSLEQDMPLVFNRYVNSVHHLDSQFQRIFEFLNNEHLLENTIVIVTGDHGEEFMEKGRWGHNSTFVDEQIRVPFILKIPGQAPALIDDMTSHLDIAPTILSLLGVKNSPADFSHGENLLDASQQGLHTRTYTIVADWDRMAYIGKDYKAVLPLNATALASTLVTTADDKPVKDPDLFFQNHQTELIQIFRDLNRFNK